jgi:nucleotide-binding universal stress UspA family protein
VSETSAGGVACLLVGIDFSGGATAALRAAERIARRLGASVRLAYAIEPGSAVGGSVPRAAAGWLATMGYERRQLTILSGRPGTALAREAQRVGAALIIVGSHGTSGFQPLALGSTAARLPLVAPCPVLVVGPGAPGSAIRAPESSESLPSAN